MPGCTGGITPTRRQVRVWAVMVTLQTAGTGLAVGGAGAVGYYGVAKPAYTAINESIFEPYSMKNPRTVSTEGTMPGEPMLFSSAIREQYKKGMTAGKFADDGDLTLSLSNLRRG